MSLASSFGYYYQSLECREDDPYWKYKGGLEMYYTGESFKPEDPALSIAKTAACMLCGRYFFMGAAYYHIGRALYTAAVETVEGYRAQATERRDLSFLGYIKQLNRGFYQRPLGSLTKAGVAFACALPFSMISLLPTFGIFPQLLDSTLVENAWFAFALYALYHPQYPRVVLSKLEGLLEPLVGPSQDGPLDALERLRPSKWLGWAPVGREAWEDNAKIMDDESNESSGGGLNPPPGDRQW